MKETSSNKISPEDNLLIQHINKLKTLNASFSNTTTSEPINNAGELSKIIEEMEKYVSLQNKSEIPELIKRIESLQSENNFLKSKLRHQSATSVIEKINLSSSKDLLLELNRFSLELAYLPYNEIFPFIISKLRELFRLQAAWITTYNEETSDLTVQYSSLSKKENSLLVKLLGGQLLNKKFPVTKENYDRIINDIYEIIPTIHELSFGAIPEFIGKPLQKILGIGWFVGLGLLHKNKLIGTMIMSGYKNRPYPNRDEILAFTGIVVNALVRKKAEESLSVSENRYKLILESIPMGMHIYELTDENKLVFIGYNPAANQILGIDHSDFIGKTIEEVFPPLKVTEVPARYKDVIKTGSVWKTEQIDYEDDKINSAFNVVAFKITSNQMAAMFLDITKNKIMQEALIESEEKYRTLFQNSALAIGIRSIDGSDTEFNEAYQRMLGYSLEELKEMTQEQLTHPEDIHITKRNMKLVAEGELDVVVYKKRYIHKNGKIIWGEVCVQPLKGAYGNIVAIIGTIIDITKRKEAEDLLKISEERWKFALEGAGDGVWDWNLISNKVFFSDSWKKMLGYEPHEISDSLDEWSRRVHPEDIQKCFHDINLHFDGKTDVYQNEHRMLCKDGTYKWILDRGKIVERTPDGKPLRIIGTHTDIDKQKRNIEELEKKNIFIQTILDNLPIGLAVNEFDSGQANYLNKKFCEIYGWNKEILTDINHFFEVVYPDPDYRNKISSKIIADIATGDPEKMKWENNKITTQTGEERLVDAVNIPIPEQNIMVSTVQDVTARRKAEELLQNNINQLALLLQTNESLTQTFDLQEIMQIITDASCKLLEVGSAAIYLLENKNLYLGATTPPLPDVFPESFRNARLIDHPNIQKSIEENRTIIIPDVKNAASSEEERKITEMRDLRTLAFIPLAGKRGIVGTLIVGTTKTPRKISEAQLALCQTLATQASIAIENASLYKSMQNEISERKRAEEEIKKNQKNLTLFFSQSLDGFYFTTFNEPQYWNENIDKEKVLDYAFSNQLINDVNDAFLKQYGAKREDLIGKPVSLFFKNDTEYGRNIRRKIFDSGRLHIETQEFRMDGTPIWIEGEYICLYDEEGRITGTFGAQRDITQRKTAEEQIQNSLKEKEVLLKEVHHRVKNNFQLINNLLSLESDLMTDESMINTYNEMQTRIRSLSLAHEILYSTSNFAAINFSTYVKDLTDYLQRSFFKSSQRIEIIHDIDEIDYEPGIIITLGIIINELVTNAAKYAFPDNKTGKITISLKQDGFKHVLKILDNGAGFSDNINIDNINSFGLYLVKTLSTQLDGILTINTNRSGTTFIIEFKLDEL